MTATTRPDPRAWTDDRINAAIRGVIACRDRGAELPHEYQAECRCPALTECRAGRGRKVGPYPAAVSLDECLRCRDAAAGA